MAVDDLGRVTPLDGVRYLNAADQVLEDMLTGWRRQQLSRNLGLETIGGRERISKVHGIVEPDFDAEITAMPLGWLFGLDDEWSAGCGRTDDELRVVRRACRDQLAVAYGRG